MGSFIVGLFLFPRSLWRALKLGRRVPNNLYHGITYNDALLDRTVGELRRIITTPRNK
jgi:hypothetical protein